MERSRRKLLAPPSRGKLKVPTTTRLAYSGKKNPLVDRFLRTRRHERAKYRP